MGSLTSHRVIYKQGLWDGAYDLSSLSEKTRESNHLQMSEQRQHFLLSYLKTLSVGPAGIWTHDLPHGSPVLYQASQPVGGDKNQNPSLSFSDVTLSETQSVVKIATEWSIHRHHTLFTQIKIMQKAFVTN